MSVSKNDYVQFCNDMVGGSMLTLFDGNSLAKFGKTASDIMVNQ